MAERILIDLTKYRFPIGESCDHSPPEGYFNNPDTVGLKSIRELAVFRFTCRRCEEAPCIAVCPADALEKDPDGIISRSINLCVSCKSCVTICPFGTMMTDFFKHHRDKKNYFDIHNKSELEKFIRNSPEGTVSIVDMDEDPEHNIYKLDDHILIKEFSWDIKKL